MNTEIPQWALKAANEICFREEVHLNEPRVAAIIARFAPQSATASTQEGELEKLRATLEAYRKRARKLYTPDVAATKIAEDEARMRDVDKRLEVAEAVLRYYGLEVVNEISEGVKMLVTDEKDGVKQCAYVRVIPGGEYAKDQSELALLRPIPPPPPATGEPPAKEGETPRVDSAMFDREEVWVHTTHEDRFVYVQFARQLERELTAAKAELAEAQLQKQGPLIQLQAIKSTTQPLIQENDAQRDRIAELEQHIVTIKTRLAQLEAAADEGKKPQKG
jgi:hypothetical protein